MKQVPTTVLLGMLVLTSFCLGHADISLDEFWTEPVILWIATALPTGRCKSAFHQWMQDILEKVHQKCLEKEHEPQDMILSSCTWDKFGEKLASAGGRQIGLFDEITAFFSSMNMYSSQRMQLSDTREFQDFLQMYTGKTKTRETITGNCNYKMSNNSFTMMGFSQPFAVLPIIRDVNNNSKGFTSRILWYFPKPIYCKRQETKLTPEEKQLVKTFTELFVDFLSQLYINGEDSYSIEEIGKVKTVAVTRRHFEITDAADKLYDEFHDEWELNICKQHRHDPLIGGLFSRGKSQLLRLAVPLELLLQMMNITNNNHSTVGPQAVAGTSGQQQQPLQNNGDTVEGSQDGGGNDDNASDGGDYDDDNVDDDIEKDESLPPVIFKNIPLQQKISTTTIAVAHSIVRASINQLCVLNKKKIDDENEVGVPAASLHPYHHLIKPLLLQPGKVVSFSILTQKNLFRKSFNNENGRQLAKTVADKLKDVGIGMIETFTIPGNKCQVTFFIKDSAPEPENDAMLFATKLSAFGVSLPSYIQMYQPTVPKDVEESQRHSQEYHARKDQHVQSPSKRPRIN